MKKLIVVLLIGLILGGCEKSPIKNVSVKFYEPIDRTNTIPETLLKANLINYEKYIDLYYEEPQIITVGVYTEENQYYICGWGWRLSKDPNRSMIISKSGVLVCLWSDGDRVKEGKLVE